MNYEESIINGVIHWRTNGPQGNIRGWTPFSEEELKKREQYQNQDKEEK
jgi:hypothetical protein